MRYLRVAIVVLLCTCLARAAAATGDAVVSLTGMGTYRLVSASPVPEAQRFFRQGTSLVWGFNPDEAARAFTQAAHLDPRCALCWWGLAWALGPTINADPAPGAERRIRDALASAQGLAGDSTDRTRALVTALRARHPVSGIDEEAYAAAMRRVAARRPNDADIATLAAEALLNLHPYDWWERDGTPKPWTPEIERLLLRALQLQPDHPGANHYWIHLQESSPRPERALTSARVLESVVPGSGHLLHMPAHIYMRVGRYADASAANERSIAADTRYESEVDASRAYRVGYAAHNRHFLWASAAMEGRSAVAIAAAQAAYVTACGPNRSDRSTGILQHYYALPLFALVRFGRWNDILTDTLPPDVAEPYPRAIWHYARGTAYARTGRVDAAREELRALQREAISPALAQVRIKNINYATSLVRIADLTLQADVALAVGDPSAAVALLRKATEVEDSLHFDEPHLWLAPTRHALGAALLKAGRPLDAEAVFRQDLAHYPENGWALRGLAAALRAQGRRETAEAVERRFDAAWRAADVMLAGPRF